MVQRIDDSQPIDRDTTPDVADDDDRLGEAIEEYLALAERDQAPDLEEFLARHEDMKDDLRAALEGLELVHGLVGRAAARRPRARGAARARRVAGVGPPDRRLPGRPRAGPRRHGDGLRGGARRARPPGGAEGAGHARGARLLGAAAVPQRGQDGRRAAPHPHRAGLRRRPGRRPVLLRHAADRGERAGPGDPPPAAHPGGRVGPGRVVVLPGRAAAADAGSSSFSSRFGQIWLRVSPGWLWRQPRHVPRSAAARVRRGVAGPTGCRPAQVRSGLEGIGVLHPMPVGDSTASWASRRIEREPSAERTPGDPSGSTIGPGRTPAGSCTRRKPGRGDEPPPFDPPRGSAYFRWVAARSASSRPTPWRTRITKA